MFAEFILHFQYLSFVTFSYVLFLLCRINDIIISPPADCLLHCSCLEMVAGGPEGSCCSSNHVWGFNDVLCIDVSFLLHLNSAVQLNIH